MIRKTKRRVNRRCWEDITQAEKDAVCRRYQDIGMTQEEAGLPYRIKGGFVRRILQEAGIPIRKPGEMTDYTRARKRAERGAA